MIYSHCPHRLPPIQLSTVTQFPSTCDTLLSRIPLIQNRSISLPTFFGGIKTRTPRPETPPGIDLLNALIKHLDEQIGPAPIPENVKIAVARFVEYCDGRTMNSEQAELVNRALTHLRGLRRQALEEGMEGASKNPERDASKLLLPIKLLRAIMVVSRGASEEHITLMRLGFDDIVSGHRLRPMIFEISHYVMACCAAGQLEEAEQLCRTHADYLERHPHCKKVWEDLLMGYAKEGDEPGMLRVLEHIMTLEGSLETLPSRLYSIPVEFYCERNDLKNARMWHCRAMADRFGATLPVYIISLKTCLRTKQFEWGKELLQEIWRRNDEDPAFNMGKDAWNTVILFLAEVGEGLDAVSRLFAEKGGPELDIDTINGIMECAIKNENYLVAESYLQALGERGLQPNIRTIELRIEMGIKRDNLDDAISAFLDLKFTQDIPRDYTAGIPQRLLLILANRYPDCDVQKLSNMYTDLMDWNVRLYPTVLPSVVNVFLEKRSFADVTIIINRHVGHYSSKRRRKIVALLQDFIARPTTSFSEAWEAYIILARSFPDASVGRRTGIMREFFHFGKPLMAVRVLEHMFATEDQKPNREAYTEAYVGIGKARSIDGLQRAHRQMNIDPFIEPDTNLLNSLMFAYSLCGLINKAFFIYEDIRRSSEGPNHATLSIVLDMCGRLRSGGLARTRQLWGKYKAMGIKFSENNIASYIEALARHEQWDEALDVVKNMEKEHGFLPGGQIITTLFTTFHRDRLPELETYLESSQAATWLLVKEELNAKLSDKPELHDPGRHDPNPDIIRTTDGRYEYLVADPDENPLLQASGGVSLQDGAGRIVEEVISKELVERHVVEKMGGRKDEP